MSFVQQIGEAHRSVSLDSAALDFTKYVKALVATKGRRDDALALAVARGASSRLQTMLKTPISIDKVSDDIPAEGIDQPLLINLDLWKRPNRCLVSGLIYRKYRRETCSKLKLCARRIALSPPLQILERFLGSHQSAFE